MGSQFQPCKEACTAEKDTQWQSRSNKKSPSNKNLFSSRIRLCASSGSLTNGNQNDMIRRYKLDRQKYDEPSKRAEEEVSSSQVGTPQIQCSRVDMGGRNRRKAIDTATIRRREGLGRMLIQRFGLTVSNEEKDDKSDNDRKECMAEVILKICMNNQDHLIDIVDKIENSYRNKQIRFQSPNDSSVNKELQTFLESVGKAELDFLDMVFHNDKFLFGQQKQSQTFSRDIEQNVVDIKKLIMEQMQFPGSDCLIYQKLQKKGSELIRDGKVCFFILAGGKCSRFLTTASKQTRTSLQYSDSQISDKNRKDRYSSKTTSSLSKQFQPLNIPSQRSILELIIHRFIALSRLLNTHLTLYLGISPDKIQDFKMLFEKINLEKANITLYPFAQKVIGAVDAEGKLVVEDSNLASLWSVGTADMWNILSGDQLLNFPSVNELIQKGFQYIQVLGTSNILQKCFDCFALGLAKQNDLDWTTKVVQSYEQSQITNRTKQSKLTNRNGNKNVESKIFMNAKGQVYVCDPQEIDNYPQNCKYTFMNSSIFKLEYVSRVLKSEDWQCLCPRKKTHFTNNLPPFSNHRNVISYEKDYTDIFRFINKINHYQITNFNSSSQIESKQKTRWKLILCDQSDYYPFVYKSNNHSDIESASIALSQLHKSYIGVSGHFRLEIDPYVSLEGQDLEQLKKDIECSEQDLIFIEHTPNK